VNGGTAMGHRRAHPVTRRLETKDLVRGVGLGLVIVVDIWGMMDTRVSKGLTHSNVTCVIIHHTNAMWLPMFGRQQ